MIPVAARHGSGDVVRWDPARDADEVAALWGEAPGDVRSDLAGLPAGIEPVALVAGPGDPGGARLLAVALYVPPSVTRLAKASLARLALAPGVVAERGEALVAWAEARARADGATTAEVVVRRAPELPARLTARGYALVDAMVRMRRAEGPRTVPPLPGDLVEVPVGVAGVDAWVHAYNASFAKVPFAAPTTRAECEQALRDPGHDPELVRVVMAGTEPVAFLHVALLADGAGEVRTIGVVPAAQGRGLGRWTLRRGEQLLDGRGAREVILRVAETNRPARALYEREGYVEVSRNGAWSRALEGSR